MKKPSVFLGLALCLLSSPAWSLNASLLFSMPSSVDPPDKLTITVEGFGYTKTDSNLDITGNTFLPASAGGSDGLELHAKVPPQTPLFQPVVEVWLKTDYAGQLNVQTSSGFSAFDPWTIVDESTSTEKFYRFIQLGHSGTLNYNSFFGLMTATSDDPDFKDAKFTITGFTQYQPIPEGSSALGFGLLISLGIATVCLRRRRRNGIEEGR